MVHISDYASHDMSCECRVGRVEQAHWRKFQRINHSSVVIFVDWYVEVIPGSRHWEFIEFYRWLIVHIHLLHKYVNTIGTCNVIPDVGGSRVQWTVHMV